MGWAARGEGGFVTGKRADIAEATRVVVKIGSSSLTTPDGQIDDGRIAGLVAVLVGRVRAGGQAVLVSSGAIAAGLAPLGLPRRPRDLATQQAAASVGQGLLMARYSAAFAALGIQAGQILLTADDLMRRAHYRNAQRTLGRLLELGIVPVVNENDTVATDEIRFGDNDRLAALVAHVIRAGALILLSDVDGLYDIDPRRPGARRITRVENRSDLAGVSLGPAGRAVRGDLAVGTAALTDVGTGGMITKVDAALIATEAGIPTVVADAGQAAAALEGGPVGTYFAPHDRRPTTRKLWLAHAAAARGRLLLDPGAVRAVLGGRASLLPAGITGVGGTFDAGDPVDLCDGDGHVMARGLVNYDAAEIPALMGRSTRELAAERGPEYEREVVHRDDLVLLVRPRREAAGRHSSS
jgi:glutamate 5-kinase